MDYKEQWLDRAENPFASHHFQLPVGRLHYLDEGSGPAVLMVHGTPTWAFLYRKLVKALSPHYRCVVPDHLGFGLSDKPSGWAYTPKAHAANLSGLIDHLGLRDLTLVVHDFGGPIGLSYAVEHPENVARLVIFNTFMWSLRDQPQVRLSGRLFASPLGRFLYERLGFSARVMMRLAAKDEGELPAGVHRQYLQAIANPTTRHATWVLARELIGSSDWYDNLWRRRANLAGKPALLLWGLRDPAFGPAALARWRELFPSAKVVEYPEVGHFVPEARGKEAADEIEAFIARAPLEAERGPGKAA